MGDPFLNYLALFLLFFVVVVLFYGIIAIHDIPHMIADSRNHPHQDAIYAAGWVSLFTLHALWPFLWIWAMAYRPDRGWGFAGPPPSSCRTNDAVGAGPPPAAASMVPPPVASELEELRRRIAELESQRRDGRRIMELLLILIYVSICYVIFKIFRIPVNQWSLATATLGGIIGISLLLLIMNYNHPFTNNARIYFAVTPVLPAGEGPRDRGAGAGEHAAQGRRRAVPDRSEALRIRRRPEESCARGSRAERQAAQGLARPGDRRRRKSRRAVRAGAAELRSASRAVREEGHRAGHARHFRTQSGDRETVVGGRPEPRRSARGLPIRRISTASTPRSPA